MAASAKFPIKKKVPQHKDRYVTLVSHVFRTQKQSPCCTVDVLRFETSFQVNNHASRLLALSYYTSGSLAKPLASGDLMW